MKNSKAIVTLAVGRKYLENWQQLCQNNWQKYAEKHGYDLICLDQPLDTSTRAQKRSPAWQKCLILSQPFSKQYERIVWIDSDILINANSAPCIAQNVPLHKVGAVNEWSVPNSELFTQVLQRRYQHLYCEDLDSMQAMMVAYYQGFGLPPKFNKVVQSGVMVLSPDHHRDILERVYHKYEDKGSSEWNYEMRPLSWELLEADQVHWIDHRFNRVWSDYMYLHYPFLLEQQSASIAHRIYRKFQRMITALGVQTNLKLKTNCVNTAFLNNFFLHFAGSSHDMWLLDSKLCR